MSAKDEIDLNDVALLVRVVHAQSFSVAARERGVPVSTVSRRVARLEATLGLRLLERTTRRLRLTDAGRAYFAHVESAVDDIAQGADLVRELRREPQGRVRVLAPLVLGASVGSVLAMFLERHPRVSVELELDDRRLDPLAEGFDLAIFTGVVDSGDLVARPLWQTSRKLLYASPRYIAAHGAPRRVPDLGKHACIATRIAHGMATWDLVVARRKRAFTFAPRFYVSEFAAAHRATIAGIGIALLPEVHCLEDVAAKRLVRVLPEAEGVAGGVHLVYRARGARSAAVRACIDHFLTTLPATDPARARSRR